jgi:hypothetical protein
VCFNFKLRVKLATFTRKCKVCLFGFVSEILRERGEEERGGRRQRGMWRNNTKVRQSRKFNYFIYFSIEKKKLEYALFPLPSLSSFSPFSPFSPIFLFYIKYTSQQSCNQVWYCSLLALTLFHKTTHLNFISVQCFYLLP